MNDSEIVTLAQYERRVTRLETIIFGVEGEGGLMSRLVLLEQRVNTLSMRLILFIGLGSAIVSKSADAVMSGVSVLAKHLIPG